MREFLAQNGFWILAVIVSGVFAVRVALLLKKAHKIDREGIETDAVVSRITENWDSETHSLSYTTYVTYRDRDGNMLESPMEFSRNPEHAKGDEIRIRYIPGEKKLVREVKQ